MSTRLERLRQALDLASCDAFISLSPPANQYLTGFTGSTSALLATRTEAVFFCDFRYTEQAQHQVQEFAVEETADALPEALAKRLNALGVTVAAFDPAVMTVAAHALLAKLFNGQLQSQPVLLNGLRQVKDAEEIESIRAAQAITETVLAEALDALADGAWGPKVTERDLSAWIDYSFRTRGAEGPAFPTIALFGSRSSLVHGQPDGRALQRGDIVLIDMGCRQAGYCSDLTRTCIYGTLPPPWFSEVYAIVHEAQAAAIAAIRPGMTGKDVDAVARERIAQAGHGDRFGHGLGHSLGIEVHEEPRLRKAATTPLAPGMVVTVEPGIYLPGQGGVRIEDIVVVTENGCEVLTRAPKELRIL